ncbi:phosphonate metabolism protein/1,5-bisphosphokinase (PRPP-forming) PhnN [Cupriavidus sp. 2TAF22]|uniref:phosphonate metabolism protein/1,5-bisphosphokinase (PRPP-forming) PhnN n=1 Tax=unclassified Cupriavidus TaxID=2640874 RepID=UPI003F92C8D5
MRSEDFSTISTAPLGKPVAAGTFFLVVGPSGAGKDSLMDGARAALAGDARYVFARRVITRAAGAPGEDHEGVDECEFAAREAAGEFLMTWQAHGLRYGLPAATLRELECGRHVVANGSRSVVAALAQRMRNFMVIHVTAPAAVLAQRIAARGRESGDAVRRRLERAPDPMPAGVPCVSVCNDGTLEAGVMHFVHALRSTAIALALRPVPVSAEGAHIAYVSPAVADAVRHARVAVRAGGLELPAALHVLDSAALLGDHEVGLSGPLRERLGAVAGATVRVRRLPEPASRASLRAKLRGEPLDEAGFEAVLRDAVEGRYTELELTAFLVAASRQLSDAEVVAVARARTRFSRRIDWSEPIVVDKHSMGGVPGSRITLIVVPIVAAHGLAMPKTSSRAITSASGTADAMETLAQVDLDFEGVRRCVAQARACIAWNGRLNHSPVDDVMNAITRPLGLDTNRWSVASILSKKYTAGSTHVIVDLPYGPQAKLASEAEARELAALFEVVGQGLGMHVRAFATDGSKPIGRGVGPALEVRDVRLVLDGDARAPADLRDKALFFAGEILAFDPAIGTAAAGRQRAAQLLASGAARAALDAIVAAQGAKPVADKPAAHVHEVVAQSAGVVTQIDGFAISGIARSAGAPRCPGAGVDLLCAVGERVVPGQALLRIHAGNAADLEAAREACALLRAGGARAMPPAISVVPG